MPPCVRVVVLLCFLAGAAWTARAQQPAGPGPELPKLLDELRADRARLLDKAAPAVRGAIEDAERILTAQKGQQGWEFRKAVKLLRTHRHEAAVPVLLLHLHELFGNTTWLVGHELLATLGVLTGHPFPDRQTETTVKQLASEWWLPGRETIKVDLAAMPEERRQAVAAKLLDLSARQLSLSEARADDPRVIADRLHPYAHPGSRSDTARWFADELANELVPCLLAAGERPDQRWLALPLLLELRRAGRLPELPPDASPGRRLAVLIVRWALEAQLDAERVVALARDGTAPGDVRATALVMLGAAGTLAGDAALLEAIDRDDPLLRGAALQAAGQRRTLAFVQRIGALLGRDPAGPGCIACYQVLGRIKGVAAERVLVGCLDQLLRVHPGDGPEGVFKAACAALGEAAGTPVGGTRTELERALVQWRTQNPERPVADWLQDLSSSDASLRDRAARGLVRLGAEAVPALRDALASKDASMRVRAAGVLAELGAEGQAAAPALVETLAEETDAIGEVAARALRAMGAAALPALLDGLAQRSVVARRRVVELLAGLTPDGRQGLEKALGDADELVRRSAVLGLARCGPAAREALERGLKDASPAVRAVTVQALGALGQAALPALSRAVRDKELLVRAAAIKGLASCAEAGAEVVVEAALADAGLRANATTTCCALGAAAVSALTSGASKAKDAAGRVWAVQTLGALRQAAACPALIKALSDKEAQVRLEAARGIMLLGPSAGADARKALRRAAEKDKDEAVTLSARALADLGEPAPGR